MNHTLKHSSSDTHNDGNNRHVQKFDEIVSKQQQWQFATPGYFISRIGARI
jgi:hypothetical protein